jgi:hypothetical protein
LPRHSRGRRARSRSCSRIGPRHLGVDVEGADVVSEPHEILVGSPFDIGELRVPLATPAPHEGERRDATHGQAHDEQKGRDADTPTVAARADSASTAGGSFLHATDEIRQRCRGIAWM